MMALALLSAFCFGWCFGALWAAYWTQGVNERKLARHFHQERPWPADAREAARVRARRVLR